MDADFEAGIELSYKESVRRDRAIKAAYSGVLLDSPNLARFHIFEFWDNRLVRY